MTILKKTPERLCIGCQTVHPKKELVRIVRSPEGVFSVDFKGKMPGRGAYVCPEPGCLKKAVKARAIERALNVPIPAEIYERLEREMEDGNGG